ncbi:NVEALA domain-containing protein [Bacteroides sp. KH569_7]|uniref:NVEALA domain-containing protein n=1 Tax=Bacteroides muris (ex Fokt et al. 2023) TaxID=2937417 RepID=A0A9X2P1V8_9BACE|nr:NVEALA domain-containing protein [Bacteroides muris (ex Fokt et al. 2023)]MCR6509848.1 NVEALA domain-containing protein [Bacteroides muris (ex Fokt et al. 2023)]
MKRKFMKAAFVAAFAAVAGYGVYTNQKTETMSDLMLANVEALARGEGDVNPMCPNGCLSNGNGCLCHYWFPTYREA